MQVEKDRYPDTHATKHSLWVPTANTSKISVTTTALTTHDMKQNRKASPAVPALPLSRRWRRLNNPRCGSASGGHEPVCLQWFCWYWIHGLRQTENNREEQYYVNHFILYRCMTVRCIQVIHSVKSMTFESSWVSCVAIDASEGWLVTQPVIRTE